MRPSKKGGVLAMKRLGFITAGCTDMEGARKEFTRFFTEKVDIQNFPALRDLLPAARDLADDELQEAVQQASTLVTGA